MEQQEMLSLLQKIEESNRKQLLYTRIMAISALVAVVCFAGVFFLIQGFLPQINALVDQIPGVVAQMETVLSNLEIVTTQLASVDFAGMVEAVNILVATGQSGLEETVESLQSIDFDTLNQAIRDLAAVIEPMAKLSKIFK